MSGRSDLVYRLLKSRLLNSPFPGWNEVDGDLISHLSTSMLVKADRDQVMDIVSLSHRTEVAADPDEVSFPLCYVSHMLTAQQQLIKTFVQRSLSLLRPETVETLRATMDLGRYKREDGTLPVIAHPHSWRLNVSTDIDAVLRPERMAWMDDDDDMDDASFAQRAVDELYSRFERYEVLT
jgi:hypothetical protein